MDQYLNIFIDKEYPKFIDKYLKTKTLKRLQNVTQFCGCDYTKLYNPKFLYTRFDHSLVVAHMTWHFTKNKEETLAALFHDVGTPCFAHTIDYVFGDYLKQETSERNIVSVINEDEELLKYLKEDGINLDNLKNYSDYHILENKSPKLCTDRLDGVLHTCYIWLHTHKLEEIKEVYDDIVVLRNEDEVEELGFSSKEIALKFVRMVYNYAKELQGNKDKYVMKYISEIVKLSIDKNLITIDDLYDKKEKDICNIFSENFLTWNIFNSTTKLITTDNLPENNFFISFATKKRNVIPLLKTDKGNKRVNIVLNEAKNIYDRYENYFDSKYAYVEDIDEIK